VRITAVRAISLVVEAPDTGSADQAQEAVVLLVETDEGLTGVAEVNHTPAAVRAFVDARPTSNQTRGIQDIVVGRDPREVSDLRRELLAGNQSSARRGCGLAVLNAVDVALWDLSAQAENVPLWRLLWGDRASEPQAYVTLYTGPGSLAESLVGVEMLLARAAALECSSYKIEPLVECCSADEVEEFVAHGRSLVGADAALLVDVYQRFATARDAARCAERIARHGVQLLETPLPIDDVAEHALLASLTDMPLAGAELYESPWEFAMLLAFGGVRIAQPWANRLGVSATLEVMERARALGADVILGGWNATPVGNLLGIHLAAGHGPGLAVEYAPAAVYPDGFELRRVAAPEPPLVNGRFPLPQAPGLGVDLDHELLDHYAAAVG